jgi:hypothetical protein
MRQDDDITTQDNVDEVGLALMLLMLLMLRERNRARS